MGNFLSRKYFRIFQLRFDPSAVLAHYHFFVLGAITIAESRWQHSLMQNNSFAREFFRVGKL